jgi:hypothetical protein
MTQATLPEAAKNQRWAALVRSAPALWTGLSATLARFDDIPDITQLNRAARRTEIRNAREQPIVFIEQRQPCGQRAYERHIFEHGQVLTRPGLWHDVFNACMWLTYPHIKAALNAVHLRQTDTTRRTLASDTATVFDESGAILIGPDPRLATWLAQHDWQAAFVTHRHLWATHHLLVVGHAVLEKLANPYPGMIAKVIYQPWPAVTEQLLRRPPKGLDVIVAQRWQKDEFTRPADLFPVPVLGVPGADPANNDPAYYDNTEVFRPRRSTT